MFTGTDLKLAEKLVQTIRFFNAKGWSPATSTNYSVRSSNPNEFIISKSGVDKSQFELTDLILINDQGVVLPPYNLTGVKSSAETEIHTELYKRFPKVNCVLHTHSLLGTILSQAMVKQWELRFEGLEILKGLEGNATHEMTEGLPIVPNSQDMKDIMQFLEPQFNKQATLHGFLIAGHGLYSWGKDIPTAKRHIETFEFLLECYQVTRRI
ncbi:MAG TPA: methylthioribulose 1-phosphate dehydratase [Bacteriovoracaceae bacterium]|nr:methylthioribulose 1-phosphate dehydratase [Bacteriovoracaceae bacterium]